VSDTDRSNGRQESVQPKGYAIFLPAVLLCAIVTVGATLRLVDLPNRPMHCDEAVHAIKFGALLERGEYRYDPDEYHGPTLNYLTLPVAWAFSRSKLAELTETHLRLVPAIFGTLMIALVYLLRKELGAVAMLCAGLLTAVSPAMVFYSRYYIQEMLLVCFTFGAMIALWKSAVLLIEQWQPRQSARTDFVQLPPPDHAQNSRRILPTLLWPLLLGICLGLMHATKETFVIAVFAMGVAGASTLLISWATAVSSGDSRHDLATGHSVQAATGSRRPLLMTGIASLIVLLTAAGVSMLLLSTFLKNPDGIYDSVYTYWTYVERAAGKEDASVHVHWWGYYLQILFWWREEGGPLWTELAIAAFALIGLLAGLIGRGMDARTASFVRFLGVYSLVMIAVYSLFAYKTPWCALGFLHGAILLAGVGMAVLVRVTPGYMLKGVVILVLVAAIGQLAWQAYRASFVDCEHPHNPYAYSPTTSDVPEFAEYIRTIALGHADGKAMHIQVVCPQADFWPLPWYLRDLSRIGWFDRAPDEQTAPAQVIITKPQMQPALIKYLYFDQPPGHRHLYLQLPPKEDGTEWTLRPLEPLIVFVQRDFWLEYQASDAADGREEMKP